jgi:hypothetical protein
LQSVDILKYPGLAELKRPLSAWGYLLFLNSAKTKQNNPEKM